MCPTSYPLPPVKLFIPEGLGMEPGFVCDPEYGHFKNVLGGNNLLEDWLMMAKPAIVL